MEGRIVIVGYKPKPGKQDQLRQLMKEHYSILKSQDLVTDRDSIIMQAKDGTIIEVFEWKSKSAMENAHQNSVILDLWKQYSSVCDYIPVGQVKETSELFSSFAPFQ